MFDFITDSVENIFDILGDLVEGELPSKRLVATLVKDGVSIYAIAEATGFATDVIEQLLDD